MRIDPAARRTLLALTRPIAELAQQFFDGDAPTIVSEAAPSAEDDDAALAADPPWPAPLDAVERAFHLAPLEKAALLCLLAAEVELPFRKLIAGEQRDARKPWLELGTLAGVLRLDRAQLPSLFELFLPAGKLRARGLVLVDEPPESAETPMLYLRVKATRRLLRHCLGIHELPEGMRLVRKPAVELADSLLPEAQRDDLLWRVRNAILRRERLVVDLHGTEGVGKKFLAEGMARSLARPLLLVDVRQWDRRNLAQHLADVERESVLASAAVDAAAARVEQADADGAAADDEEPPIPADAIPYLDHWDVLVDGGREEPPPSIDPEDAQPSAAPRRPLPPALVQFFARHEGVVFLGARERYPQLDRLDTSVVRVALAFPGPAQRRVLWERAIAQSGVALAPGLDADELGRKFALDPARIVAATRAAVELAVERHRGTDVLLDREEILAASRRQLQHELASLAVRMDKAHKWEDLVIPVEVYESLLELISYVKHSSFVYDQQGFARRHSVNRGLSALFAGPPGTGKTMCASIVARELEMELFRVDLSRIVSKWIGETEKNLGKVFDEAQRSHAVILFDEADSLFARRTEVKSSIDRYANLEVSYLLQRMEQFSGVTVLTTNFEDTIDPAFKRRITFKMRFERPDAEARAALWAKMYPPEATLAPDVDFREIGERFELSGGSIRNAVIRSAFLAAEAGTPITHEHVMLAAAREAREMGALVPERRRRRADEDEDETEVVATGRPRTSDGAARAPGTADDGDDERDAAAPPERVRATDDDDGAVPPPHAERAPDDDDRGDEPIPPPRRLPPRMVPITRPRR